MNQNLIIAAFFLFLLSTFTIVQGQTIASAHDENVAYFAKQIASKFQRGICPNTGRSASGHVQHWTYYPESRRYKIELQARWIGRPHAFAAEQRYLVEGTLYVNRDGSSPSFETTYKNRAVEVTEKNSQWFAGTVLTIAVLSALDE